MNLTKLALPASIALLAFSQGFSDPAQLVSVVGTVSTQEVTSEHWQWEENDNYYNPSGSDPAPFLVPDGKVLVLDMLVVANGAQGSTVVLDGGPMQNLMFYWGVLAGYEAPLGVDLGGIRVSAGHIVSVQSVGPTDRGFGTLVCTLVDA